MLSFRTTAALLLGKTCYKLLRLMGRHASTLPGLVVEKLSPSVLGVLADSMTKDIVVVTGTNGKTSTAKIIKKLLDTKGKCISNDSGSNFTRGVITALMIHTSLRGKVEADYVVLEVDEAYVPAVCELLRPKVLLALNILRDQLDRYGELETIANFIQKAAVFSTTIIINSNDELLVSKTNHLASKRRLFGASKQLLQQITNESNLYGATSNQNDHSLHTDVLLTTYKFDYTLNKSTFSYRIGDKPPEQISWLIHGVHNALNAVAAILTTQEVAKLDAAIVGESLADMKPAYGRGESFVIDGKKVVLNLVKNPSGFNQNLDTYLANNTLTAVAIFINDNYADGRDVSWLWDVNVEKLKQLDGYIMVGGERKYDMALCLELNSINYEVLTDKSTTKQLDQLFRVSEMRNIVIYATYTAMLDIRHYLRAKSGGENG